MLDAPRGNPLPSVPNASHAASISFTRETFAATAPALPSESLPAAAATASSLTTPLERTKSSFSVEPSDIVAMGVVILAIGAVTVAIIISIGFMHGTVPGREATEIILGCVSGSAITGVAAAILGGKGKTSGGRSRKTPWIDR